jgi:predicted permease
MTLLNRLASILRWHLRRDKVERDLDDEMRSYVELSAASRIRDGVPAAEARRLAALELGGVEQTKERVRTARHGGLIDEVGRDVRYAFRTFRRSPGFVAVVVMTLALGIGTNTAIFSLIDALLLRWLPVPNPQELVQLKMYQPDSAGPGGESFSYAIVRGLAEERDVFASLAGFSNNTFTVGSGSSMIKETGALVTGAYYETLGVKPAIGRLLEREDDEPGAPLAVVISDRYWDRQFLRNPSAVGQTILLNGAPATIVGASAPGFTGGTVGWSADLTVTVAAFGDVNAFTKQVSGPGNFWLIVLARPARGLSIAQANARLATAWSRIGDAVIAPHWPAARRKTFTDSRLILEPGGTGSSFLREIYGKPLMVLMAAVVVVLLIACANVASLMLARASTRQREIAVRLAIGAGKGRIVRQLLIESTLLSFMGAGLGIFLAWISSRLLVSSMTTGPFEVTFDLTPNAQVLAFSGAIAIATALLFGLAPAFQTSRAPLSPALKDDGLRSGFRSRWLSSLVAAQVGLSLLLLVGAGLFVRTLRNLQQIDPGFNREGVLLVEFEEKGPLVSLELLEDVRRIPGVVSATLSTHTPLSGSSWSDVAVPKGQPLPQRDTARFVGAAPRFFETMQMQIIAGREFTDRDTPASPQVAMITEAFARRYFPNQQPLGQYLSASVSGVKKDLEIVGLAKDANWSGLRRPATPTVYVPYRQLEGTTVFTTFEMRVADRGANTAAAIRQTMQRRMPAMAVQVRPLSAQVEGTIGQERAMATLATAFGVLALAIACIGLYGLEAYTVARKTKEIGVRIALGAARQRIVGMVLRSAVRLVAIGLLIGLPAAWAASRWVQAMLFGLRPVDPVSIVGAIALLTAAALLAAYLPARRASLVDPVVALRHE